MTKIFISYSRTDSKIAQCLLNDLVQEGYDVFLDTVSIPIGEQWWQRTVNFIKDCDYFMFVDTIQSSKSTFCDCELRYAAALKKTIIPIGQSNDNQHYNTLLAKNQRYEYSLDDQNRRSALRIKVNQANPSPSPPRDIQEPKNPLDAINTFTDEIIKQADLMTNVDHQSNLYSKIENHLNNLALEVKERYLPMLKRILDHDNFNGGYKKRITGLIENIHKELNENPIPRQPQKIESVWDHADDEAVGDLADDIIEGIVIPFLGPGLTPAVYYDKLENMIVEMIWFRCFGEVETDGRIARRQQLINAVIGLPCNSCHFYVNERPDGQCPMLAGLPPNNDNNDPLYIEQQLSIALNNIRYLSDFYLLSKHNDQDDFRALRNCLQECFDPNILNDSDGVLAFFKKLPDKLSVHNLENGGKVFDLILTTSFISSSHFTNISSENGLEFFFELQEPINNNSSEEICLWMKQGSTKMLVSKKRQTRALKDDLWKKLWRFDERSPFFFQRLDQSKERKLPIVVSFHGAPDSSKISESYATDNENHPTFPILSKTQFNSLINSINKFLPGDIQKVITIRPLLLIGFSRNDLEIQQLVRQLLQYDDSGKTDLSNMKIYFVHQERPMQTSEHRKYERLSIMAWKSICPKIIFIPVTSTGKFIIDLEHLILKKVEQSSSTTL